MGAWYYCEAGRVMGPLSEQEVLAAVDEGLLPPEAPVWTAGMTAWAPLGATTEFFQRFSQSERQEARRQMPPDLPPLPVTGDPSPAPVYPQTYPPQNVPLVQMNFGPQYQPYPAGYAPKNKITAGLLAFFLGSLGIHRFYLGYSGIGLTMLLITICTCGYGGIITGPWALIEGILCLTGSMNDSKGLPLTG